MTIAAIKTSWYNLLRAIIKKFYDVVSRLSINLPSRETKRFEALKIANVIYKNVDRCIKNKDYENAITATHELIKIMKRSGADHYRLKKYYQLIKLLEEANELQKEE